MKRLLSALIALTLLLGVVPVGAVPAKEAPAAGAVAPQEVNHEMYCYTYSGTIYKLNPQDPSVCETVVNGLRSGPSMVYYDGSFYLHSFVGLTFKSNGTDLTDLTQLNYVDNDEFLSDGMTVDYANGIIYEIGIDMAGDNYFAVFDPQTGDVDIGPMVADYNSWLVGITVTADGRIIMGENFGSAIYEWHSDTNTLETLFEPDEVSSWSTVFYNPNDDTLYGISGSSLYSISLETESITLINTYDTGFGYCNLCSVYEPESVNVIPAEGIEMDVTALSLGYGMTDYVAPRVLPTNATDRSFTLTSSAPEICAVDAEGNLTVGNTTGTAIITATSNDGGFTAECTVRVTPLGGLGSALNIGEGTLQFITTHEYPFKSAKLGSRTVALWTDTEQFPTEGHLYCYADLNEGDYVGFEMYTAYKGSVWIYFDADAKNLETGETYTIHHLTDSISSDWYNCRLTVPETGRYLIGIVVMDMSLAQITGSIVAIDNFYAGPELAATSISLPGTVTVNAGRHIDLNCTFAPEAVEYYGDISVTSSNASVAVIDNGKILGLAPGEAVITVSDNISGLTADCTVTVAESAEQRIYGITKDDSAQRLISVSTDDASDYYSLGTLGQDSILCAEYANGNVYGISSQGELITWQNTDPNNISSLGSISISGTFNGDAPTAANIEEMTYSTYDETMYVVIKDPTAELENLPYYLGTVDLETGMIAVSAERMFYLTNSAGGNYLFDAITVDSEGIAYIAMELYPQVSLCTLDLKDIPNAPVRLTEDTFNTSQLKGFSGIEGGDFALCYDHDSEKIIAHYYYYGWVDSLMGGMSGIVELDIKNGTGRNLGYNTQYLQQPLEGALPLVYLRSIYVIEDYGLMGDLNNDGYVSFADVGALYAYILGVDTPTHGDRYADFNGDGVVNFADVADLYSYIIGG